MIVTIEVRLDYRIEGVANVLLQIEAASLPDQRIIETETKVQHPQHFARIPAEENVGERSWVRVRDRFDCAYTARVEIDRAGYDLRKLAATPVEELPPDAIKYLMGSRFIPSERLQRFVEAEFPGLEGGARIAAMRDWIEANLDYVRGSSDENTTALDTFVERAGVCRDYAHVMIGLARAALIPARMVGVYAPSVEPPDFHAVAEVFLDGDWRLVDATGMATPGEMVRIGVGRDAADIAFMQVYGASELKEQSVKVKRA
jgi:transglutaminase-like putative cysteine protease